MTSFFFNEWTCRPFSAHWKLCVCCWCISFLLLPSEDTLLCETKMDKRLYNMLLTIVKLLGFWQSRDFRMGRNSISQQKSFLPVKLNCVRLFSLSCSSALSFTCGPRGFESCRPDSVRDLQKASWNKKNKPIFTMLVLLYNPFLYWKIFRETQRVVNKCWYDIYGKHISLLAVTHYCYSAMQVNNISVLC